MLHSPEPCWPQNWAYTGPFGFGGKETDKSPLFCFVSGSLHRGHARLVDCQDSLKPCSAFLHILLDISSFGCVLHISFFLSFIISCLSVFLRLFLSLQPTPFVTPRPKDVVSTHRKMKKVLMEQKIALVGPLSEAVKLGSHGDIPP